MVRVFNRQFFQSSVFFRSLFCLVSDLSNIVLQDLDYASMYDPRTCFVLLLFSFVCFFVLRADVHPSQRNKQTQTTS